MLSTSEFVGSMERHGFGPYLGVPCSFLRPFINFVIERAEYIAANNEGEAIAIGSGAYLAGRRPVVMFQNSGLGNTVNPLTSLNYVFRIPLLLITTWRGEPGHSDAPQHELMGEITVDLLEVLRIPHDLFPEDDSQVEPKLERAVRSMETTELPYALIMRRNSVTNCELGGANGHRDGGASRGRRFATDPAAGPSMNRCEVVTAVADAAGPQALLIATTGKTARELFAYRDRATNFYVVGSMGCASSLALGIALYAPQHQVVVLDGDGAALMRLEAMVSIGHYRPSNLVHVVLDNAVYESTGGQQTLSGGVDFPALALACGYRTAGSAARRQGLLERLESARHDPGPHLIHVRIRQGSDPDLPRLSLSPPDLAERFRRAVNPAARLAHA